MAVHARRARVVARRLLHALLQSIAIVLVGASVAAAAPIDIGLVVDGSGSIDSSDWSLQRDGFSAALRDPANVPLDGSVAITVVQFSSGTQVEVPRTIIDSQANLDGVVDAVEGMQQRGSSTDPGAGIIATTAALAPLRDPTRAVLCLSTDGTTNEGVSLPSAVAQAKSGGIERLSVVGIEDGGNRAALRSHYAPEVFGGGAFTLARNTVEFASLIGGSCFGSAVKLRALEINQAVQDWHNSVELIADRTTIVRAFVEAAAGEPDTRVAGRLIGRRNGAELPGSPLAAINAGGAVLARQNIVGRRGKLEESVNFQLPSSWTSGSVELEFEAGGAPVDCKEPGSGASAANDCQEIAGFTGATSLGVSLFSVIVNGSGPDTNVLAEQAARVRSNLPVSNLTTAMRGLAYTSKPTVEQVNDDLLRVKEVERTSCSGLCNTNARDVYYGLFDGTAVGGLNGMANGIPGQTGSSVVNNLPARSSAGYPRNTIAHEIAHTLGVHHAVDNSKGIRDRRFWLFGPGLKDGQCNEVASSSAPGHTPFVTVGGNKRPALGPISGDDDAVWGLDSRFARMDESGLAVSSPEKVWALMSYCSDGTGQRRWISQFEWGQALNGVRSRASGGGGGGAETGEVETPADAVAPPAGQRGVLVSGKVSGEPAVASLSGVLPLPYPGDAAPGSGPFVLTVLDASGSTLATRRFTPAVQHGDNAGGVGESDAEAGVFSETLSVPTAAVISRVRVVRDTQGVLLDTSSASAPAPAPTGVGSSTNTIGTSDATIDWSGASGSEFAVLFSPDDGQTWTPVGFDVTASELVVDPSTLSETTEGKFAVASTNGFDGSVAEVSGITVTNADPEIAIIAPAADGPPASGLQAISFEATAADRDEELPDGAVTWSSNLAGNLGAGQSLSVNASSLPEGEHEITATVTDSHGATASAKTKVQVFRVPPPPASADLTVTGRAADVTGGETATLTFNATNAGPDRARSVRVTATFGPGLTPIRPADQDGWTCEVNGNRLSCERPDVASGATAKLDVPVATEAVSVPTSRRVELEIDASTADPQPSDNASAVGFTVVPPPPSAPGTPAGTVPDTTPGSGPGAANSAPLVPFTDRTPLGQLRTQFAKDAAGLPRALTVLRKKGSAKLKVTVPGAGTYSVEVVRVGKKTVRVAKGQITVQKGRVKSLVLKVTPAGRKILRAGKGDLRAIARYKPKGQGSPLTVELPIVIKR